MIWNNFSTSWIARDEVGSSKIINSGDFKRTFSISAICCSATDNLPAIAFGSILIPYSFINALTLAVMDFLSIRPCLRGSTFRYKFSSTVSSPINVSSWNTMAIPSSCACNGLCMDTCFPFRKISPLSA